jgi:hypothetical protein
VLPAEKPLEVMREAVKAVSTSPRELDGWMEARLNQPIGANGDTNESLNGGNDHAILRILWHFTRLPEWNFGFTNPSAAIGCSSLSIHVLSAAFLIGLAAAPMGARTMLAILASHGH